MPHSGAYRRDSRTEKKLVSSQNSHQAQLSCSCLFQAWRGNDGKILSPPLSYSSRAGYLLGLYLGNYKLVFNLSVLLYTILFVICLAMCPENLTTSLAVFKRHLFNDFESQDRGFYFLIKAHECRKKSY